MSKGTYKKFKPYTSLTFDEYWLAQDELWDISLKESKKQKQERKSKLNDKAVPDVQERIRDNKISEE